MFFYAAALWSVPIFITIWPISGLPGDSAGGFCHRSFIAAAIVKLITSDKKYYVNFYSKPGKHPFPGQSAANITLGNQALPYDNPMDDFSGLFFFKVFSDSGHHIDIVNG